MEIEGQKLRDTFTWNKNGIDIKRRHWGGVGGGGT